MLKCAVNLHSYLSNSEFVRRKDLIKAIKVIKEANQVHCFECWNVPRQHTAAEKVGRLTNEYKL